MRLLKKSKAARIGATLMVLLVGAGTASVANGFTDYHAAALDQYPTTTVGVTATATVGASGNLGQNGAGNPGANGSHSSNGSGNPGQGSKGVSGQKDNGGQAGVSGAAGSVNQLPFTGLNLVTLLTVALLLAALGLFLRAIQRGTREHRRARSGA